LAGRRHLRADDTFFIEVALMREPTQGVVPFIKIGAAVGVLPAGDCTA
jgi:hypothetical protein